MAALALMIRDIIRLAFKGEDRGGTLHAQLKSFQEVLLHDLDGEDLNHYRRVVAALGDTIRLMGEVDEAIEKSGGWPLK